MPERLDSISERRCLPKRTARCIFACPRLDKTCAARHASRMSRERPKLSGVWTPRAGRLQLVVPQGVPRLVTFHRGMLLVRSGMLVVQRVGIRGLSAHGAAADEAGVAAQTLSPDVMLVGSLARPVRLWLSARGKAPVVEQISFESPPLSTEQQTSLPVSEDGLRSSVEPSFPLAVVARDSTRVTGHLVESLLSASEPQLTGHLLAALFCELTSLNHAGASRLGHAGCVTDPTVALAVELLEANLAQAWSLDELSRRLGSSRAALVRRFRDAVGQPPLRFLTQLRMLKAAELLPTGASLASIASHVGYESEFALSRAFKRFHGVSPSAYRFKHQSQRPLARAA